MRQRIETNCTNSRRGLRHDLAPVATGLPGGHSEWEPPDPFSNSEVKTLCADASVDFVDVKVGHCQALNLMNGNPHRLNALVGVFFRLEFRSGMPARGAAAPADRARGRRDTYPRPEAPREIPAVPHGALPLTGSNPRSAVSWGRSGDRAHRIPSLAELSGTRWVHCMDRNHDGRQRKTH